MFGEVGGVGGREFWKLYKVDLEFYGWVGFRFLLLYRFFFSSIFLRFYIELLFSLKILVRIGLSFVFL